MNQSSYVVGLILACVGWTTSVYAQEPSETTAPESAGGRVLEEVIVTVQKREENLQDTTISVTALTGETLERMFVTDLRDIFPVVPNLVVTHNVNSLSVGAIYIRALGVTSSAGYIDPRVGVVIDGVYHGTNLLSLQDLFDIERIEVLRGPQGTLYGTNTIGGVINIITKQPTGEFGGTAQVTLGNYGRRNLAASINLPLVDGLLTGKIAVMSKNFDGYYTDVVNGRSLAGIDKFSARGYLKYTPNDAFSATLQLQYGRGRNDSPVVINYSDPDQALYVPGFSLALDDPETFRSFSGEFNYSDIDHDGVILTMDFDIGGIQFVSITGYQDFTFDEWTDQDATPEFLFVTDILNKNRQFTQELRATLNPTDSTELLLGAYYFDRNWQLDQELFPEFAAPGAGLVLPTDNDQDDVAISGFAQGYWNATETVRLQAGVRYTWQEKEMQVRARTAFGDAVVVDNRFQAKDSWTNWGWRIGADWHPTDAVMIYGNQTRGFTSGGFNGRISSEAQIGPYDPETVDSWEIGLKADWLNRRVRTNLALFYSDYTDMQVEQNLFDEASGSFITTLANAASSTIKGAELDFSAVLTDRLTLIGSISYLDASYDEFLFNLDGNPFTPQEDATHLEFSNAPKWKTSLSATFKVDTGPGYTTFYVMWTSSSLRHTDSRNHPVGQVDGLDLLDASISWTDNDDRWSVSLFAKNLLDKEYITSGVHAPGTLNFGYYGPPRIVAVQLAYNF